MDKEKGTWGLVCCHWRSEQASVCSAPAIECYRKCVVLRLDRQGGAEPHGTHHKFTGVPVHGTWRMVGREEGHKQR